MGYFRAETKGSPIVDFVCWRSKIYSFNVFDASEPIPGVKFPMNARDKAEATNVPPFQIKSIQHEEYVRLYNNGALTNVVNSFIGFKLHQMRLIISSWIYMTEHLSICFQEYTIEQ